MTVVNGTSADDNIHSFSEIFSRHGYPAIVHTDNGAPFNGNDSHLLKKYFRLVGVLEKLEKTRVQDILGLCVFSDHLPPMSGTLFFFRAPKR